MLADQASRELAALDDAAIQVKVAQWQAEARAIAIAGNSNDDSNSNLDSSGNGTRSSSGNNGNGGGGGGNGGHEEDVGTDGSLHHPQQQTTPPPSLTQGAGAAPTGSEELADDSHVGYETALAPYPAALSGM